MGLVLLAPWAGKKAFSISVANTAAKVVGGYY